MNIKKNKNGFTLVELIVVVCIFGIILSAILNFIKPANEIHNDTQATMDANVISSGLIEYMDDELRYATNILVLKDYLGVPQVSSDGRVGSNPVQFTNCLVIDNNNPRGYSDKSYDPNEDDTATRMKARGSVVKVTKLDSDGFNYNNSTIAKGKSFYDKFTFTITIGSNVLNKEAFEKDNSLSTLEIRLQAFQPVYRDGEFVFTKRKFDRDAQNGEDGTIEKEKGAVLNLTNINLSGNDSSKLEVIDVADTNPTQVIGLFDGAGYPTASVPAGATSYQAECYNALREVSYVGTNGENVTTVPRYTYIFYQKKKSASKCTVSFKFASDSPFTPDADVIAPYTDVAKGTLFKNFPSIPTAPSGYNPGQWLGPDGNPVIPSDGFTIDGDVTFRLQYTKKEPSPNEVKILWLDPAGNEYVTTYQDKATGGEFVAVEVPAGSPVDMNEFDFVWVQQGTGAAVDTVSVTGPLTFIAQATAKPHVKFSADGTNVDCEIRVSKGTVISNSAIPTVPADKMPSGKMLDKWVLKGDESKTADTTPIDADCTFVAQFKDKPTIPDGAKMVIKVHVVNFNVNNNYFQVQNNGAQFKISLDGGEIKTSYYTSYDGVLANNKTYEFTLYNSEGARLVISDCSAKTFDTEGMAYEVWVKDGKLFDSDPG
jgi:prepilin-type N-terminal cleavage/methylation domain-containing protein